MKTERGDQSVWKEVYERGKQIAAEFDIEQYMPRTTGRQQQRVNEPKTCWQRAVYLPLIDHLIQEMNDRLLSQEDRFPGQNLLPTRLQGLTNDVQDKMYAEYTNDLTDKREYNNEMLRWKKRGGVNIQSPRGQNCTLCAFILFL